jgi:hypothetical protein
MPRNLTIGSDFGLKFRQHRVSIIPQSGTVETIRNLASISQQSIPLFSYLYHLPAHTGTGRSERRSEMSGKDFIPKEPLDFDFWFNNYITKLSGRRPEGRRPQAGGGNKSGVSSVKMALIKDSYQSWVNLYNSHLNAQFRLKQYARSLKTLEQCCKDAAPEEYALRSKAQSDLKNFRQELKIWEQKSNKTFQKLKDAIPVIMRLLK